MSVDLDREMRRIKTNLERTGETEAEGALTLDEWVAILEKWQYLCAYCLRVPFEVLDHIIPVDAGGGTIAENCVPACKTCNSRKKSSVLILKLLSSDERIIYLQDILSRICDSLHGLKPNSFP